MPMEGRDEEDISGCIGCWGVGIRNCWALILAGGII
jgi:hypothetical protein